MLCSDRFSCKRLNLNVALQDVRAWFPGRFNRKRLKGSKGPQDCSMALASLHAVLLNVCKVMAPFTPFLTEAMYQNLKKCLAPGTAPESVHFCDFPAQVRRKILLSSHDLVILLYVTLSGVWLCWGETNRLAFCKT